MSRDLKGQDLSLTLSDAGGAIVASLGVGIESFQATMVTDKIESKNLDGRRIGQAFNGWKGSMSLNLRNTAAHTFVDAYQTALDSGLEHRITIRQSVFDPSLGVKRTWTYRHCVLDFDEGSYSRSSPVKLKVDWETGEKRIPG